MDLDDYELIITRISNGAASKTEIMDYIYKLKKELENYKRRYSDGEQN